MTAAAVLLGGCATSWHAKSRSALIAYETHGQPDRLDTRLLVNSDRTFLYEAGGVGKAARKKGTIDRETYDRLVDAFDRSGFTELKDEYACAKGDTSSGGCGENTPPGGCGDDHHRHAGPREDRIRENWITISFRGQSVRVFGCSPMLLIPIHQHLVGILAEIEAPR